MKKKISDLNLIQKNFLLKNTDEKTYFTSNSNITGLNIPKLYHSAKHKKFSRSSSLSNTQKNFGKTAINFYNTLNREEKIDYVNNIIKNAFQKDSFDFMALKRKKINISELIHQYDDSDKSKKFKKNKIYRIPYPLLYCITNRKVENNSSNLLKKILTKENNNLTKRQELTIKYSKISKIFNTDLSKLVNDYELSSKTPKISRGHFPILNKYLQEKFNKIYFKNINIKNKYAQSMYDNANWKKINKIKKNRKLNTSNYGKIYGKKRKNENEDFKNVIETPRNKSMNLFNHNNNMKNVKIIQDRFNNYYEEKLRGNNKIKIDTNINNIIKDVAHLRYNNKLMAFTDKINAV